MPLTLRGTQVTIKCVLSPGPRFLGVGQKLCVLAPFSESAFPVTTMLTKFPEHCHVWLHPITEVLIHGQFCAPGTCGSV